MNSENSTIRDAWPDDAAAILEIYNPVVLNTPISFELTPPSLAEMQQRMARASDRFPWLVMEQAGEICGYAYAIPFRTREAYQHTVETTVYVHHDHRGKLVGRQLMEHLLSQLSEAGHHMVIAGIVLPNPASVALHQRLGFQPIGVFPEVGRKLNAWHDVGFWSLALSPTDDD